MPREVALVVAIVFSNMVLGVSVLAWFQTRKRRMELQAEVQTKLIERFGSSAELVEFLKSDTGRDFVNGVQKGTIVVTHERVLAGIRRAIMLTFIGLGFLVMWGIFDTEFFAVPAIFFLSLGIGHIVATLVSLKLSRGYTTVAESTATPLQYDSSGQQ